MIVACETQGCENEGIQIEIADTWTDTEGTQQPVTVVQCGVCLGWILPPPIAEQSADETEESPDGPNG